MFGESQLPYVQALICIALESQAFTKFASVMPASAKCEWRNMRGKLMERCIPDRNVASGEDGGDSVADRGWPNSLGYPLWSLLSSSHWSFWLSSMLNGGCVYVTGIYIYICIKGMLH